LNGEKKMASIDASDKLRKGNHERIKRGEKEGEGLGEGAFRWRNSTMTRDELCQFFSVPPVNSDRFCPE
jgi:hypothetical protein